MIYAKVTLLRDVMQQRMKQSMLYSHKGGIMGTHRDGTQMPVKQQEWHIDHAPTLDQVLNQAK